MEQLIQALESENIKQGYAALLQLEERIAQSDAYHDYLPYFFSLLEKESSYVRTRGLRLIIADAIWDHDGMIAQHLPQLLARLRDEKPTVVRELIKRLPQLAKAQPQLCSRLKRALQEDVDIYQESMQALIYQDCKKAMRQIHQISIAWEETI